MNIGDIEHQAIRYLHRTNLAATLQGWIQNDGIPKEVLEKTITAVWPSDKAVMTVLQNDISLTHQQMEPDFWAIRSLEDIYRTTLFDMATAKVFASVRQGLDRYELALRQTLMSSKPLSALALALLGLFVQEYIWSGYYSSGFISLGIAQAKLGLRESESIWRALEELIGASLIEKRDTVIITFELPLKIRRLLLDRFGLDKVWAQSNPLAALDQAEESRIVMSHPLHPGE